MPLVSMQYIFFGNQNGYGYHVGFISLNYAMTKCLTMDRKSYANICLYVGSVLLRERCL